MAIKSTHLAENNHNYRTAHKYFKKQTKKRPFVYKILLPYSKEYQDGPNILAFHVLVANTIHLFLKPCQKQKLPQKYKKYKTLGAFCVGSNSIVQFSMYRQTKK